MNNIGFQDKDRLVSVREMEEDKNNENSLRPKTLDEYIGQEENKSNLKVYLKAAQARGDRMDHILLYGPPGLGKTTLAGVIANEMGGNLHITSAPVLQKNGDVAALLTNLEEGDVLFIDEIHRLPMQLDETLYSAMEDFAIDILIGNGPSAQSIRLNLPKFTLIGATTRYGQISSPLRARFGIDFKLEMYTQEELATIINRSAGILDIECTPEGAMALAKCSRGTPRVANRLLKRARDFAQVMGNGIIDEPAAKMALEAMRIDELGLDKLDRDLLSAIINIYSGGPVGLDTLAATLGQASVTLEDVCEPYLMQLGFLTRTPRGRMVTNLAYKHLGLKNPNMGDSVQQQTFDEL